MKNVFDLAVELWESATENVVNFLLYLTCAIILITLPLWIIPYKLIKRKRGKKT